MQYGAATFAHNLAGSGMHGPRKLMEIDRPSSPLHHKSLLALNQRCTQPGLCLTGVRTVCAQEGCPHARITIQSIMRHLTCWEGPRLLAEAAAPCCSAPHPTARSTMQLPLWPVLLRLLTGRQIDGLLRTSGLCARRGMRMGSSPCIEWRTKMGCRRA